MSPFDPEFEISVSVLLSQAAYDVANGLPPKLPVGYVKVADITANIGKLAAHIAEATNSQHQILRAMLLESANPNIFGIIAQNGSSVAIAFRGTETPEEWLKNFDFIHVPYQFVPNFGDVHQGFQFVYDTVETSVKAGLALCGARARTLITGHSLGAALAVLCAPDVAANMSSGLPPEVHNFAGPRVAAPDLDPIKSTYADQFNKIVSTCYRMVNRWDIVPHLPPAVTLYKHVGTGVGIDGGFTLDLAHAHSLQLSYLTGLEKLLPQVAHQMHLAAVA